MKKRILVLLAFLLSGCGSTTDQAQPEITIQAETLDRDVIMAETDPELVNSLWAFTHLTQDLLISEENEVYSPMSLYLAMSMLLPATSETTHQELLEGLSLSSAEDFEDQVQPLLKKNNILDEEEDFASLLTNSVWLQSGRDDYDAEILDMLETNYQTMHQFTDFKNEDETKELIEGFIDEQTNGFIEELDLTVDPDTDLLLLNTLYFKDAWLEEFTQEIEFDFTTTDGEIIPVNGVTKTLENPKYHQDEDTEMVMVPFKNGHQMLFIKPEDIDQFFAQGKLSELNTILNDLENQSGLNVYFTMPEVDIESDFRALNAFLSSVGFQELMSDSPHLSYIEGRDEGMFINDIIQQARIAVDREGAEAAAYTSIGIEETSLPIVEEEIEMTLDQPYVMIVLSPENIPMFVSAVYHPESE